MTNRIILFLSLILVLGGCNPYREVKFESFKLSSFELVSTSRATIVFAAAIDNPLKSSISLLSVDGTVLKEYTSFAKITLLEEVVVPAHTKGEVMVRISIELLDPMALLSMGLNIRSWDLEDFRTSAKITFKLGSGGSKTFKFRNVPLERMVNSFK